MTEEIQQSRPRRSNLYNSGGGGGLLSDKTERFPTFDYYNVEGQGGHIQRTLTGKRNRVLRHNMIDQIVIANGGDIICG